jgi:hypothetical protein
LGLFSSVTDNGAELLNFGALIALHLALMASVITNIPEEKLELALQGHGRPCRTAK